MQDIASTSEMPLLSEEDGKQRRQSNNMVKGSNSRLSENTVIIRSTQKPRHFNEYASGQAISPRRLLELNKLQLRENRNVRRES